MGILMTRQDQHELNISNLKSRRIEFRKRIHSNIKYRIEELRKELVKNSFSSKPDLFLHKQLLKELKQANEELTSYAIQ
jgi:hypothetical protein